MGHQIEKVLEKAVLEKVEPILEETSRSKEILTSKEAAEFLRLPLLHFQADRPQLTAPSSDRAAFRVPSRRAYRVGAL